MQTYQIEINDAQRVTMGQALITYIKEFRGIHEDSDIDRATVLEDYLYVIYGSSTYQFQITEADRVLIMQALRTYVRKYSGIEQEADIEDAVNLEEMFLQMPEIEQYHPGCNHGLCF